jgi:hypothetical protein
VCRGSQGAGGLNRVRACRLLSRAEHFEEALPNVDHMAFVAGSIDDVERMLTDNNVFYKKVSDLGRRTPAMQTLGSSRTCVVVQFESEKTGISQIFLFDPGKTLSVGNEKFRKVLTWIGNI